MIPKDASVHVAEGASLEVADDVRFGSKCRIVCHERITIGAGAVLEDEVVVLDFDHRHDDVETPIRLQGVVTAPVVIGERALLRKGCVVLKGVTVGAGAEVGHHAVVTKDVPPGARVEGVPARPVA